ncbi:hypothetical protein Tco_0812974 [Tanacetum coccineum]
MEKKNKNENPTQYYDITINILFAIVSEPYFLFHFLTFFSYFSLRICTSHLFDPEFSAHLIHREFQALVAFVTLATVKPLLIGLECGYLVISSVFGKSSTSSEVLEWNGKTTWGQIADLKAVKEETWDGFVADMLLFAKNSVFLGYLEFLPH